MSMQAYPKTHLKTALALALCLLVAITALPAKQTPEMSRVPVSLAIQPGDLQLQDILVDLQCPF